MYNEDNIYICVQVLFCNSNFLLNYRKKQHVKTWNKTSFQIKDFRFKLKFFYALFFSIIQ